MSHLFCWYRPVWVHVFYLVIARLSSSQSSKLTDSCQTTQLCEAPRCLDLTKLFLQTQIRVLPIDHFYPKPLFEY